jgi:hypothetical protein
VKKPIAVGTQECSTNWLVTSWIRLVKAFWLEFNALQSEDRLLAKVFVTSNTKGISSFAAAAVSQQVMESKTVHFDSNQLWFPSGELSTV